jgi:hypothetical protein
MNKQGVLRTIAICAGAIGLILGINTGAQAQVGYENDEVVATVSYDWCQASLEVANSTSTGKYYARGLFTLATTTHGRPCSGWLQVSTDMGHTWARKGDVHTGSGGVFVTTYYYYDGDANYRARVCTGDIAWDPSDYSCSAAW